MVASSTAPVHHDHHPTQWVRYTWRVTLTLMVLACIAVWHISLLWRYRDESPSVLGSWLLTIFVLVLATRQLARLVAPPARSFLMRHFARLDAVGVVFIVFLLLLLLLFHLGFERAGSDGRSYFVQVRSLVMDWDLDFANDEAVFGARDARRYAFGAPILWSPFFILGHVWLNALNLLGADLRVDGYYFPYQRAIGLGTLLYGFVGLVLIYRVLRRYFSKGLACLSTLGLCGTSFLIWYLTVDNSMVHGVSMFATTLFLFLWHRCRDVPTRVPWVWLGAAAGVMTMVRWQNTARSWCFPWVTSCGHPGALGAEVAVLGCGQAAETWSGSPEPHSPPSCHSSCSGRPPTGLGSTYRFVSTRFNRRGFLRT